MENEQFMKAALALAQESVTTQTGGPFGAVIVKDNVIIGKGRNQVTLNNDPTAHAEIMAIRDACETINHFSLDNCTLYTTCEPCPMCLSAIYWARIKNVVYAASSKAAEKIGFIDRYIFDELLKPIIERKIPMTQCMEKEANDILKTWSELPGKIEY